MAWISTRDIAGLEALELADKARPAWYGQRCRSGLVDRASEYSLRDALLTKKLVAYKGRRQLSPTYWHKNAVDQCSSIWFLRDNVFLVWPHEDAELASQDIIETPNTGNVVSNQTNSSIRQVFVCTPKKRGKSLIPLNRPRSLRPGGGAVPRGNWNA